MQASEWKLSIRILIVGKHNKVWTLSGCREKTRVVDGIKTIKAPHSQDNVKLSGLIPGSLYVAMSRTTPDFQLISWTMEMNCIIAYQGYQLNLFAAE